MARVLRVIALMMLAFALGPACAQSLATEREQARHLLRLVKDDLAGNAANQHSIDWAHTQYEARKQLIEHLTQLQAGDEVRLEAIALARQYASPANLMGKEPDYGAAAHYQAHARLQFAWGVLIETGILRKGLSLEDAVALLGMPTRFYGNRRGNYVVDWAYDSPMHVNPGLRCSIKEGLIDQVEVVSL